MSVDSRLRGLRFGAILTFVMLVAAACQPAGSVPASAPVAKAAAAGNLFLMVDTVQGSTNLSKEAAPTRSCVLSSRFAKNSQIVWRSRVFDPATNSVMDDKALSKVQVKLANGQTIDMKFGTHPKDPPGEGYWTGSWVVPSDQATGTLNYSVVATAADGRTGEFKPFNVASSLPTITDEVLPPVKA